MTGQKLLVANRGEIAIRIFRSAADLGMGTIAIYPGDDSASLHVEKADVALALPGRGAEAAMKLEPENKGLIYNLWRPGLNDDPNGDFTIFRNDKEFQELMTRYVRLEADRQGAVSS
jgi:hypothetical protein